MWLCEYMRKYHNIPACAHWHILTLNNGVCVSLRVLCPRMSRMCTCLRLRAILVCPPASCVYVSVCVCVYVWYVFQESQWLDSVSLLIKDSLEGEMLMIDNLSGSVFHHYSSPPPVCRDCKGHPQEVPP